MRPDVGKLSRFGQIDPSHALIACLVLLLAGIFFYGFRYSNTIVNVLPIAAVALCLLFLLVPQPGISTFITIAAGLSLPLAHFAVIVAAGEGVQWAHLLGSILIIHLVARILLGHRIPVAPATPWVLGFIAATLISIFAVINLPGEHITEFWKSEVQMLFGVLLYLAVTHVRLKNRHLMLLLKAMILLSVGVALFGIYQLPARFYGLPGGILRLTNPSLSAPIQSTTALLNYMRAASIFSEPSYFGHYMVGMIALSLSAAIHRPKLFGRPVIIWSIVVIQSAGLMLSQSMGSFYMLAQLVLLMLLFERGRARRKLAGILVAIILIGVVAMFSIENLSGLPAGQMLQERAYGIYKFTMGDESYMVAGESIFLRVDTARIGLDIWRDYPVIGVGLGSYTLISYRYGNLNPSGFPANTLVNTLAETGIVGLMALVGIGISSLLPLYRMFRKRRGPASTKSSRDDTIELAARMVFYLIAVEFLYFHVINSIYWPSTWFYIGLGGIIAVMARVENSRTSDNPKPAD